MGNASDNTSNPYTVLTNLATGDGSATYTTGDDADFSQPQKWFDAWADMIEDQGDLEKAQIHGQKVSTYLQAWQNAITQQQQEFNSQTTAYNADVQKKIQNAQLEQQRITTRFQGQLSINQQNALQNLQSEIQLYTAKLQRYQNEVTDYQNEVNEQVQEYTLTLQREMQAWQSHQANVFQHWGVLIQNELNEYNKELAIYQTTVQKAIQDAQMAAQEKQKEGDLTLQASIQDYTLELQNYQAQLQQYANEIQEDVQETTLKIQRDAELYKRYDNDHKKLQQQYDAAFVIMGGGQQQQGR
jgi:chromosome segregation ATPase